MELKNLVGDWGGFEELVADLHRTGTVEVEHNVILTGRAGVPRQIDVLIKHREGFYEHKILVECKCWNHRVSRLQIDAMVTAIEDLSASKGVFFTTIGYQDGAIEMARSKGIDIFIIRALTDEEWGAPGRKVDFFMQVISKGIRNVRAEFVMLAPGLPAPSLHLDLTQAKDEKAIAQKPARERSLEEVVVQSANETVKKATEDSFLLNSGADSTCYMLATTRIEFSEPRPFPLQSSVALLKAINLDVGLKIIQSRFERDRQDNFTYALVVENCVSKAAFAASRRPTSDRTEIRPVAVSSASSTDPDVFRNGSVLRIYTEGFFDMAEVDGLEEVPWTSVPRKPLPPGDSQPLVDKSSGQAPGKPGA